MKRRNFGERFSSLHFAPVNQNSIFYSVALLSGSAFVLQLLGFVYRILLGRLAGPQVVAVHSLVLSAYNVVLSCTLTGIAFSVSRIASGYQALGSGRSIKRLISLALSLFLVLFFVLAIPFAFFREVFAAKVLGNPDTASALLLLVPCLLLTGFENVHKAYFYGTKYNLPPMISEILEMILRIVCALFLFTFTRSQNLSVAESAAMIVLGMIVSELVSATFLTTIYRKSRKELNGRDDIFAPKILKDIASIALPISLSTLLSRLLSAANVVLIPQTLLRSGLSYEEAMSSFGVISGMTMPLLLVPSAFLSPLITVLIPRLSGSFALGNKSYIRRKSAKAIHVTGLIGIPAMTILLCLGKLLAVLLYQNPAAGDHLLPLSCLTLLSFYYAISESILESIGLQKSCSLLSVATGILGLSCTAFFGGTLRLGIYGYLAGELLSALLGAGICLFWLFRKTRLHPQWKNWFAIPLFASVLSALFVRIGLFWLLKLSVSPVLAILFSFSLFLLIYSVLLKLLGTDFPAYLKTTQAS